MVSQRAHNARVDSLLRLGDIVWSSGSDRKIVRWKDCVSKSSEQPLPLFEPAESYYLEDCNAHARALATFPGSSELWLVCTNGSLYAYDINKPSSKEEAKAALSAAESFQQLDDE